jgi:hypothetical protein
MSLKPSRWRRMFRRKRSGSLSSSSVHSFSDIGSVSGLEDTRIVGQVREIIFRDGTPDSDVCSSRSSIVFDNEDSVDTLTNMMKRDLLSERTIFLDALEGDEAEMRREETMKSVYVDALDDDESLENKTAIEISLVAEVHEGILGKQRD